MSEWERLCAIEEGPGTNEVREVETGKGTICLANVNGDLHALENLCPHREGPLGQGWIEGQTVVCPWHAWAFDCRTGLAELPEQAQVKVFPVKIENGSVVADLS